MKFYVIKHFQNKKYNYPIYFLRSKHKLCDSHVRCEKKKKKVQEGDSGKSVNEDDDGVKNMEYVKVKHKSVKK